MISVANEFRDQLGDWIMHRLMKGVEKQKSDAEQQLQEIGTAVSSLKEQWEMQRQMQTKSACEHLWLCLFLSP